MYVRPSYLPRVWLAPRDFWITVCSPGWKRECWKKHKLEEIVAKLRQVDVLVSQGQTVAEAVRTIGVKQFTYYRSMVI